MNMITNNYSLFPTLVQEIPDFLTDIECDVIIDNLDHSRLIDHNALVGDGSSSHSAKWHSELDFIDLSLPLKERLMNAFDGYCKTSGFSDVYITNSWVNIQKVGSQLKFHSHPHSVISCALYLYADEKSSPISFKTPNPFNSYTDIETLTDYTYEWYTLIPKTGKLIIFPSWLIHGSHGINESEQRIVLSVNTGLK